MRRNGISTTKLAEICGVSQGTVDRALNNRQGIRPETKEKILQTAKEYGYRPNMHARCIAGGKSMLIGVVVFDLNNQYFSDILTRLEAHCNSKGYSMVVMFTGKDHKKEIECIQKLYHMTADGIVLCPINDGEEYENFLLSLDIPIVTFGNKLNRLPHVGIDNCRAMVETVEYIVKRGYQNLIYVKPELAERNTFAQTERLSAFVETCEHTGSTYAITDLQHAEEALDPKRTNAYVCPTDIYAIKLLLFAKKHQAGIVGFDNNRLIDEWDLRLDSVSYNIETTAKALLDYIIDGNVRSMPIPHKLICRGSI